MEERIFLRKEPIEKGWSGDRKYKVTDERGRDFFLRVSAADRQARKRQEFLYMRAAEALGISMCGAVDFGVSREGAWILEEFVDGEMAEDVLPRLTEEGQYAYGLDAGRILKRLHGIPAAEGSEAWESFFNRKLDRKLRAYEECPVKCPGGEAFVRYIEENRPLLKGRPLSMQHGDYHIGNIMIRKSGELCVIDFDRFDTGDPWEEFNRIVWSAGSSPAFASGMIDGYFEGAVPAAFWPLLALYISSNTISSVAWGVSYSPEEKDVMLAQAADVLSWYDGMRRQIPSWYKTAK